MPQPKTDKLPSGDQWLNDIKHDGFRIIARKEGAQMRLYSRPGNHLTRRIPLIVETLSRLPLAAAIAGVVRQSKKPYPIYELAGPRVYSYEELLRTIARSAGLRPVLMRMPFAFWSAVAGLAEILPQPPLTRKH